MSDLPMHIRVDCMGGDSLIVANEPISVSTYRSGEDRQPKVMGNVIELQLWYVKTLKGYALLTKAQAEELVGAIKLKLSEMG